MDHLWWMVFSLVLSHGDGVAHDPIILEYTAMLLHCETLLERSLDSKL